MAKRQPFFNAPPVVLIFIAGFIALHLFRTLALPADQAIWLSWALAFIPGRYGGLDQAVVAQIPGGDWAAFTSPLSHAFVHGDYAHLFLNSAWMLAFATPLAWRIGTPRFIMFFAVCALAGALVFWGVHYGLFAPVVGASGAISGLMGGAFRFMFARPVYVGMEARLDEEAFTVPRARPILPLMPLREALANRQVVSMTLVFVAINLALALVPLELSGGRIAWEVHLGGYVAGFLLFGLFDPRHLRRQHLEALQ
ncbi:MAG: rhomboid family intramembrane serine protease [Pseudomonadota bacterium]